MFEGRSSTLAVLLTEMTDRMGTCIDEVSAAWIAVIRVEQVLPGWAAGVALVQRKRPVLLASNPAMDPVEQLQLDLCEGPLIDAVRTDQVVRCQDTAAATGWPQWAPAAVSWGFRSLISLPLRKPGQRASGVLTLAHPRADQLDADMTAAADFIATYVSIGLDTVRKLTNMSAAGDSKASIGVATGVLMERFGLTEVQAFAVLRRHSQDQQKKLRDVADELLATGNLPGPDPTQRRAGWTADS